MLNLVSYLNQTPIFDMWIGVAPRNVYIPKRHVFKETELHAQNIITIRGSIVNLIGGGGWVYMTI